MQSCVLHMMLGTIARMPDGLQEKVADAGETKFPARKEVGKLPQCIRCDGRSKAFYVYRTELEVNEPCNAKKWSTWQAAQMGSS